MLASVKDIINILDSIAPPSLAESWDNIGIQVGSEDWPVKRIFIALDPLPEVVKLACKDNIDLLITHHPLLMKPIKSINTNNSTGNIIQMAIEHRMTIFSAHTNLDSAFGGINDILSEIIALKDLEVLCPGQSPDFFKLVFFIPQGHEEKILEKLFQTNAGNIGEYSCCSFRNKGTGTFFPGKNSKPFNGMQGQLTHVEELRIETILEKNDIFPVINNLKKNHPYETMAYDIYPLSNSFGQDNVNYGLGRIGNLSEKVTLKKFAASIKEKMNLKYIKIIGNEEAFIKRVALCSGSGASLLENFYNSGADVFITGDIKYHDARVIEEKNLCCIDIGHFASEHIYINQLASALGRILKKKDFDLVVNTCDIEKDPFKII